MKLGDAYDANTLAALGAEALRLLCAGELDALAARFGYALRFDREPAEAIAADLQHCLSEAGATMLLPPPDQPRPTVRYFPPDSDFLVALVECLAPMDNGATLLLELIVTRKSVAKYVTVEQISLYG